MKFYDFKITDPKTPMVPSCEYTIGIVDISKEFDIDWLKDFLLEKEKILISNLDYSNDDGDTNLGDQSVTSKYIHYTIWDFEELSELKKIVRKYHDEYADYLNFKTEKVFSQGWFNVMRKSQKIDRHVHCTTNYTYLSAHITVASNYTCTNYYNPISNQVWSEPNKPGKLTIFPSWISHDTDAVMDDKERITIAMDMKNEIGYIEDVWDHKKSRWKQL